MTLFISSSSMGDVTRSIFFIHATSERTEQPPSFSVRSCEYGAAVFCSAKSNGYAELR